MTTITPENLSLLDVDRQLQSFYSNQEQDIRRFLAFTLDRRLNALLALDDLQGVIKIGAEEILPVPQMSSCLLGIINWRGKATWIVDLTELTLGNYTSVTQLASPSSPGLSNTIGLLVQKEKETLGLLVERSISIVSYHPQDCLPIEAKMFAPELSALLGGYFLDDRGEPWVVINLPKVLTAIGGK
jgi:positive phototaxis protein PixI